MCEYPGRSRKRGQGEIFKRTCSNNELREVSRGHSTTIPEVKSGEWEGPNKRKSEERMKGGQCSESRIS